MTPHEALSHCLTPHEAGPLHHWTAKLGRARVQVIRRKPNWYDVIVSHTGGGLTVGPCSDRMVSAREVLTEVRAIAVDESADTTRINEALAALVER